MERAAGADGRPPAPPDGPGDGPDAHAIDANLYAGIGVLIASALNGSPCSGLTSISVQIGLRERVAVLTFSTLILLGGLFPQLGVTTREHAAAEILKDRRQRGLEASRPITRPPAVAEAHP